MKKADIVCLESTHREKKTILRKDLLAQNILYIFPCALVYRKEHHAKPYQMLWTNLEKLTPF